MPLRNWFVETTSATARQSSQPTVTRSFGEGGQHLGAVVGGRQNEVLDADAAETREVDAGLDGDDVAGDKRCLTHLGIEPRGLVHLQADAVTEAVAEAIAEPRLLDDRAERQRSTAIALGTGNGRPPAKRVAHQQNHVVCLLELRGQRYRHKRARAVRAVAVDAAAGIDHDRLPHLDSGGRPAATCGEAPVGPEPTAVEEGGVVRTTFMDQLGHAPHDVALGAADERLLGQPREGVVEDCRRATNRRQLGAVLHLPQPLDEPAPRHELEAARGQRLEPGVRQPLRLEADPS